MSLIQDLILICSQDWVWLYIVAWLYVSYVVTIPVYNVLLHPLSKYPGPLFWGMTRIPYERESLRGLLAYKVAGLHEKYGPVVRICPDQLSYITDEALNDIYAKAPGVDALIKNPVNAAKPPNGIHGLFTTESNIEHARMRRNFSHAFSDKALREQEAILTKYLDLLIERLHEKCKDPLDLCSWYNYTTFDIIGDLTVGESFECLKLSRMHPWVALIFDHIKTVIIMRILRSLWRLDKILIWLAPSDTKAKAMRQMQTVGKMLTKRLERDYERLDFMSTAREKMNTPEGMSYEEIKETAQVMIIAGSETTATLLSGITYHLTQNPEVYQKIVTEVREAFPTEDKISIASASALKYLPVVVEEGLRMFPPVPGTQMRFVPPEGREIAGRFVPGNTIVGLNQWGTFHSPRHFRDPFKFAPERWLGDLKYKDDNRKARQPFSVGPRNCIGLNLAYAETKTILARILWNFDIELTEQSRNWMEEMKIYTFWLKQPLMVKLTPVIRA